MATTIKIDPAAGKVWCEALDAGTFPQAKGTLKRADEEGYCCLGVFARCQGASEEAVTEEDEDSEGNITEGVVKWTFALGGHEVSSDDLLDQDWADSFGISTDHQSFFASLNDGSNFIASLYHEDSAAFSPTAVFFPLLEALANDPLTSHGPVTRAGTEAKTISIHFRQHTFAEISDIIKTHML